MEKKLLDIVKSILDDTDWLEVDKQEFLKAFEKSWDAILKKE